MLTAGFGIVWALVHWVQQAKIWGQEPVNCTAAADTAILYLTGLDTYCYITSPFTFLLILYQHWGMFLLLCLFLSLRWTEMIKLGLYGLFCMSQGIWNTQKSSFSFYFFTFSWTFLCLFRKGSNYRSSLKPLRWTAGYSRVRTCLRARCCLTQRLDPAACFNSNENKLAWPGTCTCQQPPTGSVSAAVTRDK